MDNETADFQRGTSDNVSNGNVQPNSITDAKRLKNQ
jgi:hypothetical protein